jgi:hypothetical protein
MRAPRQLHLPRSRQRGSFVLIGDFLLRLELRQSASSPMSDVVVPNGRLRCESHVGPLDNPSSALVSGAVVPNGRLHVGSHVSPLDIQASWIPESCASEQAASYDRWDPMLVEACLPMPAPHCPDDEVVGLRSLQDNVEPSSEVVSNLPLDGEAFARVDQSLAVGPTLEHAPPSPVPSRETRESDPASKDWTVQAVDPEMFRSEEKQLVGHKLIKALREFKLSKLPPLSSSSRHESSSDIEATVVHLKGNQSSYRQRKAKFKSRKPGFKVV